MYRPLARDRDQNMILWAVCGEHDSNTSMQRYTINFRWQILCQHNSHWQAEGRMLQDYIITPDQTQAVFPTPSDSIITYSGPIPPDCHGTHYSVALWGCRQLRGCAVGKREKAYADPGHRRWHGVSINTHVEYTGFDRTEGGLEVE